MLLNIEARIGELAEQEPRAVTKPPRGTARGGGALPSELPPKHERLGISQKQVEHSQAIHRNPAAVAAIIKEARENEDIPTKTAVLKHIQLEKAKALPSTLAYAQGVRDERARHDALYKGLQVLLAFMQRARGKETLAFAVTLEGLLFQARAGGGKL